MSFVVLEGLDGAGKSTQLNKLISFIEERGGQCEYLHFPRFDTPVYGELIARFLRGEFGSADSVNPWLVSLIFAGDRAQAAGMMKEWLAEGKFILTDRFVYSNIAYQCAKISDPVEKKKLRDWILDLEFGHNGIPRPDVSLFLDVPFRFTESRLTQVREGDDRSYLNGKKDIHEESLGLQRQVREVYMDCAQADPALKIIDCSNGEGSMDTPDNIFNRILAEIGGLL